MAAPPSGTLVFYPATGSGVPVFVSTDSSGTPAVPIASYTNTNGYWIPAPTNSEGIPWTKSSPSQALYAGSLSVTTTVTQLPNQSGTEALIQADPANTANLLLGATSATQPFVLTPGQSLSVELANLNLLYTSSVTGTQTLNWMVRS